MSLTEQFTSAIEDLDQAERIAMYAHLIGSLLQMIDDGTASREPAAVAFEWARAFALRDRVTS